MKLFDWIKELVVSIYYLIQCRCLILGIKIWREHGGKLLIVFQPYPHVIVMCSDGIIRHGTNRKTGVWRVEEMTVSRFVYWMQLNKNRELFNLDRKDRYFGEG